MPVLEEYMGLLNFLDQAGIDYTIRHIRSESLAVVIHLPREHWEVEFMLDGETEIEIELEKFVSQGVGSTGDLRAELYAKIRENIEELERDRLERERQSSQ